MTRHIKQFKNELRNRNSYWGIFKVPHLKKYPFLKLKLKGEGLGVGRLYMYYGYSVILCNM